MTLKDKAVWGHGNEKELSGVIHVKDVAKFIKDLKATVDNLFDCPNKCEGCLYDVHNEIDRLAGDFNNHSPTKPTEVAQLPTDDSATQGLRMEQDKKDKESGVLGHSFSPGSPKGCGKVWRINKKDVWETFKECGIHGLCPECQEDEK